jgi:hypothetical protein
VKSSFILAMAVMAAAPAVGAEPCVAVRLLASAEVPFRTMQAAQLLSTQLYGEIGVLLKWEDARGRRKHTHCAEVEVEFDSQTAPGTLPGALAYTTPYQEKDVRIHLFLDRVLRGQRTGALAEANLGYVLAHEIGHMLEGVSRHSEAGVMQSHTPGAHLLRNRMTFAKADVTLIHAGLAKRLGAQSAR